MAKKRNVSDEPVAKPRPTVPIGIYITVIYFTTLFFLVFLTEKYHIPLYRGTANSFPTHWLFLLWTWYYGVPSVLAFMLAMVRTPRWPHFRNLLFGILLVQFIYSAAVYAYRQYYLYKVEDDVIQSRAARVPVSEFHYELKDTKGVGQIDEIEFTTGIDSRDLPPGTYSVYAAISQDGKILPGGGIGYSDFDVQEGAPPEQRIIFQVNPQIYSPYFERGEFVFNLGIEKIMRVDDIGEEVIMFSRWAPFLRKTSWDGVDQEIYDDIIELNYYQRIGYFRLLPVSVEKKPILFKGFGEDFVRDLDRDAVFDQLVIPFEVESDYDGPFFIQAFIDGGQYPLFYEQTARKGLNSMEFVIDADHLIHFGLDGPYRFLDIKLFNEDPECSGPLCLKTGENPFILYVDNFTSRDYLLKDFEARPSR